MTTQEKLELAAKLIEEVADTLDTSETECPHCHLKKRKNFDDYKIHQELIPIATKIRRFTKQRWAASVPSAEKD